MKFRTEIADIYLPLSITHKSKIFLIGSCFTDNIAQRLNTYKFNTLSNPFGILYNPISIDKVLNNCIENHYPQKDSFVERNGLWHHFDYHGDMSGIYLDEVKNRIRIISDATKDYILNSDFIFITFGTSNVHLRKDKGEIVANNHKFPTEYFAKTRLNIDEIVKSTNKTISNLKQLNPNIKIIFTVSPVRHIKDGIVENQKSKSVLLLAIEKLVDNITTFYFPSYELLLDDLRDYRYYAKDLVHPSETAIDYIWEKFSNTFFDDSTKRKNREIEKIVKSLNHKPFNTNTENYKEFAQRLNQKIDSFIKENPEISFE